MQLQSGQAEVVVACGTENMTQLPYYLRKARDGYRWAMASWKMA